jgi:hypothetical protein
MWRLMQRGERREGNGLGLVHDVVVALERGGRRLEEDTG